MGDMDSLDVAYIIAGFVGVIVGAVITFIWRYSEKSIYEIPSSSTTEKIDYPGSRVLSLLSSSAILVSNDDRVVQASAPTYALGIIKDEALNSKELRDAVNYSRATGETRDFDIQLVSNNRRLHLAVRVAPLTSELVIIFVNDRTREHEVEQIRKDFAANVSHELKTPIGAILALSEALDEAANDSVAVRHFSAKVGQEARRLDGLVRQIIELSRLQDDELGNKPARFNLSEVVAEAKSACLQLAEQNQIDVDVRVENGLTIFGERDQVLLALTNLVKNAIAYSKPRSRVSVSSKVDDKTISVTVVDQGVGIPAAEVDRIFERFYRVDPSRNLATGGSGLGLSIVKHVMARHQGDVKVWSKPGEGSSFTLVFPRRNA